jgi:hypothetical protein
VAAGASRRTNDANLAKFTAPTVEGVDYPSVGLAVARNDIDRGELLVRTDAATPSHAGRATSIRVVQLPHVDNVRITCDREEFSAWRAVGPDAIELDLTVGEHDLVVRTGHHGLDGSALPEPARATATGRTEAAAARRPSLRRARDRSPSRRAVAAAERKSRTVGLAQGPDRASPGSWLATPVVRWTRWGPCGEQIQRNSEGLGRAEDREGALQPLALRCQVSLLAFPGDATFDHT